MKNIGQMMLDQEALRIFQSAFTTKPRSEREEYVQQFLAKLNAERVKDGYKPLSARFVAVKLSHLTTQDLHYFLKKCSEGQSFGKCFFGMLKVRTHETP